MSRQSRLIVILAAMALISVVVLVMVAARYSKLLDESDAPRQSSDQAARAAEAQVTAAPSNRREHESRGVY